MLSEQAIKDFKAIWKKNFGEDISDEKATEEALNLLNLFNIIYRPMPKSWLNYKNDYDKQKTQTE
jgi:hypothetical protein